MVAQTLAMDPIAQRIDMKQEPQTDALPRVTVAMDTDGSTKRRASKSRQTLRTNETPNGWDLATIKEGGKRAKPEAPKFLLLLYEILDVESSRVIRWSEDGLALQILDPVTVTEQILPKYFNHTNFHSFQRQLNYFGFRKWTKSKTDICTFSHPFFRENQPELLQLIKRKKAPRRTPASGANSTTPTGTTATSASVTSKKLSPCGKRKLPSDDSTSEGFSTQGTGMHIQMNTSGIPIQPAINGMPIGSMSTPHGASSNGALAFSQDGLTRQYLPELNNVISPVAATECKKKAKKMDKKDYLASATIHAPLASPIDASNSLVNTSTVPSMSVTGFMPPSSIAAGSSSNASVCNNSHTSSDNDYSATATPTSMQLPNLNIVRSRLIQRQQAALPEQQQQSVLQQHYDHNGFPAFATPNGPQGMVVPTMENRPELLVQSMAPRAELNPGQSPVFSNSFSDPVNILLRIKKSRTSSGDGKDVGTNPEQGDDQNENLTSLHNYLLGNSLYTNRLQAQLKFIAEENEALKHLLDTKQREVDSLQGERKVLQQENAVLLEDKNKLFEINRDLLSKLFPQ
ncbi:HSF-type DNA-binding protein [Phytophthora palmivora]|uniref:HSF-type DNA-binding protein n=1 Tax=Phytophthora palmivora TaxID=4796 RepID=A0A2P4X560_9STRA|nr:HSF-type DNA-binding protein [Phytophthora palmivora]